VSVESRHVGLLVALSQSGLFLGSGSWCDGLDYRRVPSRDNNQTDRDFGRPLDDPRRSGRSLSLQGRPVRDARSRYSPASGRYCTLCYAAFDFKRRTVILANSGLPYPIRYSAKAEGDESASGLSGVSQIELPGVPLGLFAGSSYDEAAFDLAVGDAYVFCSDGVFEARDAVGREFGATRLLDVIKGHRHESSRDLVDEIFATLDEFRGARPPDDDMTAVAIKITA
jgi:hypothetical protein